MLAALAWWILGSPLASAVPLDTAGARLVPQVGHSRPVNDVAFSPDGTRLVTASDDGTAGLWDVETGAMLLRLPDHRGAVLTAAFVDGGTRIATASSGGEVFTWDPATGDRVGEVRTDTSWTSAAFTDGGRRLLAVDDAETASLWDVSTGRRSGRLAGSVVRVWPHAVGSPWIAAQTGERTVAWFKARSGALKGEVQVDGARVRSVAQHGDRLVITDGGATPLVVSIPGGARVDVVRAASDDASLFHATFAGDGTLVAVDPQDVVYLWTADGPRASPLRANLRGVVTVQPGGDLVALADDDGAVILWSATSGEVVRVLRGQIRAATAIANAAAGWIATGHADGQALVWSPSAGRLHGVYAIGQGEVEILRLHPRGLLLGTTTRDVSLYNTRGAPAPLFHLQRDLPNQRGAALSFDGTTLYTSSVFGAESWTVQPFRVSYRRQRIDGGWLTGEAVLEGPADRFKAEHAAVQPAPRWLALGTDGAVQIVDPDSGAVHGALYAFDDGNWAVIDAEGRFDTADDRALSGLQWVIDGRPYRLSQLRDRYFEPGLLAKLLGHNDEPLRDVPALSSIEAPPAVFLSGPSAAGVLEVRVEDRGSGVGRVFATLNGSDVSSMIEAACPTLRSGAPCTVDLAGQPTWLPGARNEVLIEASSGSGILRSRGLDVFVQAEGARSVDPPDLWVLAVGSGDYAGTDLDLAYAGQDAVRVGGALKLAGQRGFTPERTHVRVLSTAGGDGRPSKEALTEGFVWLASADTGDTVIVFFSGHGAAYVDGADDDYFYLLPSAGSFADLRDPALRQVRSWSGTELADAMARIPALKRLVVLDTCAAGKIDADLGAQRSLSSDAIRAHARSRERTGAWLLAGAAADKVSYEASRFGQGVLTYALLEGMQGPALDEADLLMVGRWLSWAEEQVPKLAEGIGGVQQPITRRGSSDDFPVGALPPDTRARIVLQPLRPVVVSAGVVGRGGRQDTAGCTTAINAALRDAAHAEGASFVHWDSDPIPQTWQITGTCAEASGTIRFEGFITLSGTDGPGEEYALKAQGADAASVAQAVVDSAISRIR